MAEAVDMMTSDTVTNSQTPEMPSLPLYLAGGVVALCGIFAASAALVQPDPGWMGRILLLTALGFVFSYGSRQLGIKAQTADFGFAAVILLLLAGVVSGQIALEQFLPIGADTPSLHILSALVWAGTIWAWALRSDDRVLGAAVPAMAVLGLAASVDLNNPVLICFGVFILTVIFLLIHQNYLQSRVRAAAEARTAASPRLLLAQFTQAGLCALVVLLVGMVVIVPAQAVFAHLSLTQAIRRLAAGRPTPLSGNAALRFSDDESLQIGTGAAWSSSADIVMQVTPSDGQEHYWRGRTYDVYTGAGWQSSMEENKVPADDAVAVGDRLGYGIRPNLTPGDGDEADGNEADVPPMTATFHVLGDTSQFYYAANPRQVIVDQETIRYGQGVRVFEDGQLDLMSKIPIRHPYTVVSAPAPDVARPETQARLRRAGMEYPFSVRRHYLSNIGAGITQPDDLAFFRQAVDEALQTLPPKRRDPLDEALALRDWVSQRCVYSLAPPPISEEDDHVRVFLSDERRGYCDMFASSLAILCRTAGIPARLATGFAPGDPTSDGFNLRSEDKHAWTEVYFPGTGWVALDATAGATTDGSVPRAEAKGHVSWRTWLQRLRAGLGGGWVVVLPLLLGITLILGYVAKTELYDRWRAKRSKGFSASSVPSEMSRSALGRRYARLMRAFGHLGLARCPSETPDEHIARALPLLSALEQEFGVSLSRPLVTALTGAVTQACYARPGAPVDDAGKWDDSLVRFEAASRRVFWMRLWHQVAQIRLRPVSWRSQT